MNRSNKIPAHAGFFYGKGIDFGGVVAGARGGPKGVDRPLDFEDVDPEGFGVVWNFKDSGMRHRAGIGRRF
ncbi:MAG: hypothetical protein ACR2OZ_09655 [Verrucomicrobiales bacterium]